MVGAFVMTIAVGIVTVAIRRSIPPGWAAPITRSRIATVVILLALLFLFLAFALSEFGLVITGIPMAIVVIATSLFGFRNVRTAHRIERAIDGLWSDDTREASLAMLDRLVNAGPRGRAWRAVVSLHVAGAAQQAGLAQIAYEWAARVPIADLRPPQKSLVRAFLQLPRLRFVIARAHA